MIPPSLSAIRLAEGEFGAHLAILTQWQEGYKSGIVVYTEPALWLKRGGAQLSPITADLNG